MEQEREPRGSLLRGLLSLLSGVAAAAACVLRDAPRLDVALWAVLVPILVATLLELVLRAVERVRAARRQHDDVVVPEGVAVITATPDPAVQARNDVVTEARGALLAARDRGAPLDELLALAAALREAELDLARATASCGGHVAQALRDELLLRDRRAPVESSTAPDPS